MVPSSKWFPSSLMDRAMWVHNFSQQLGVVGVSLGFSIAELAKLTDDDQWLTFVANAALALDAYKDAIRGFRMALTEGSVGDPSPVFPVDLSLAAPGGVPLAGLFERIDNMVKRIRVSPAYTPEIGGLLQIIPTKSEDIIESEMKPTLKANAMPANVVEVTFTRGKSDGIQIDMLIDHTGGWTSAGKFFKSPAILNIPDGTGLPHAVQVRARYIIGDQPVGLNSDTINVVTTP